MPNSVTFEQVEQLAVQLPPPEQLRLVARISEQLSNLMATIASSGMESERQEREAMADSLLAELDAIAESIEGNFDSAKDIRQIQEERSNRLCSLRSVVYSRKLPRTLH
jgi:predicted Zn-dependent peptidase